MTYPGFQVFFAVSGKPVVSDTKPRNSCITFRHLKTSNFTTKLIYEQTKFNKYQW